VYADGSTDATHFDPLGRVTSTVDTLGRAVDFQYDALGRLTQVTDALGNLTQYTYNEEGDRLSQTDASKHTTSFPIDVFTGRPTGRILPDNSAESRAYDAAGEVTTRTDFAGRTTSYTYDGAGRVLSRTYPDQSVVSFTYTPDGQRQTVTDARGTTTYGYDMRHRLAKLVYPDGRALTYGYDAHGNRTSLTAKVGAQSLTTSTAYDADSRPNRVTDPLGRVTSVAYDAGGNRVSLASPNSTQTTYAYDARNRLLNEVTRTTDASPVTIQSYQYTLDVGGRRTQVTEADGTVRAYGYDGIDRLTSETVTGSLSYDKTFTYDGVGNRLTQVTTGSGAASVSYGYDNRDRLTSENDTTYQYDANGNVTSKSGEATYTWDFENRLAQVAMNDGAVVSHVYDADGNRMQTSVTPSGGTPSVTNFLVDTSGDLSQVAADSDSGGGLIALYVRNGDELLAVMRPAPGNAWTTSYVHGDGLGSVRVLTDEAGTSIDSRAYQAFGAKNVEAGNDPLSYGFAGEPFDETSMLAYHRARWLDARVGRFAGMDPADIDSERPITLNRYVYASNRPTNNVDPSGHEDAEANIAALFRPAVLPQGPPGPTGPVFTDPLRAIDDALKTDWQRSMASTTPLLAGVRTPNALHPEYGGIVYILPTRAGRSYQFSYTSGTNNDAQHVDLSIASLPTGSTPLAIVHTHPNDGCFQTFPWDNMAQTCLKANQFSQADIDSLNYLGSQWAMFVTITSWIRTPNTVLVRTFGD
jgi:RHS repeat-associated protein